MARSSKPKQAPGPKGGGGFRSQKPGGKPGGKPGSKPGPGSKARRGQADGASDSWGENRADRRAGLRQEKKAEYKADRKPQGKAHGKSANKPRFADNNTPGHKGNRQRSGASGRPRTGVKPAPRDTTPASPILSLPEDAHLIPGRQPVTEWLKAKRPVSAIFCERSTNLSPIPELAQAAGITVAFAGRDELDTAVGGVMHQGVVAVAKPAPDQVLQDHLNHDLVVIADGITDARNLGAIARSAEQAGAGCLIVRARRAASTSPAAEKAAAGAFAWLPVITVSNISNAVNTLKEAGMWTVALDSGEDAHNIHTLGLMEERVALIVGEEGAGVSRVVRDRADAVAEIPMNGHLDSLNASVAAGIALFEWVRRHTK